MNKPLVITNATAICPETLIESSTVVCDNGLIADIGHADETELPSNALEIDGGGGFIAPGFVDIHCHGGDGADFMDGTTAAVRVAIAAHARHGTTTIFPTTATGSPEQLGAMFEACREVRDAWRPTEGARIVGVHLYGPFFAEEKIGCHPAPGRRDPDPAEYLGYFDTGLVSVATSAAELPGATEYYREASRRGCLVTCGHSDACWTEMQGAYEAGVRHVDHFWCAMSSVPSVADRLGWPMQASMAEFVLANSEMSTEVIADGQHLAPDLLDFALAMKGVERLCLVTDSSRALDMPPGEYRFGSAEDGEWFESDGKVGFQADRLASSVTGMDGMVRNMMSLTRASLVEAIRMATLTPAERVGVDREIGSLTAGKRADVVLLSPELRVDRVFIGGVECELARTESAG